MRPAPRSPMGQRLPSAASMPWSDHLPEAGIATLKAEVSHGPRLREKALLPVIRAIRFPATLRGI
jgi:hypothetical protein